MIQNMAFIYGSINLKVYNAAVDVKMMKNQFWENGHLGRKYGLAELWKCGRSEKINIVTCKTSHDHDDG